MIKITVEIIGIKRDKETKETNNKGCHSGFLAENCDSALLASGFLVSRSCRFWGNHLRGDINRKIYQQGSRESEQEMRDGV